MSTVSNSTASSKRLKLYTLLLGFLLLLLMLSLVAATRIQTVYPLLNFYNPNGHRYTYTNDGRHWYTMQTLKFSMSPTGYVFKNGFAQATLYNPQPSRARAIGDAFFRDPDITYVGAFKDC